MNPFEGERVSLRPFEPEDLALARAFLNQPELAGRRYLPEKYPPDLPLSEKMVAEIIELWGSLDRQIHLAVVLRENGTIIGHSGAFWRWDPLCPHVEVVIAPAHQRCGLGSEALHLLVGWLFGGMLANSISAAVADWNRDGVDFLRRQGFRPAGRDRRSGIRQGAFFDLLGFDILRVEWNPIGEDGLGP